MSAAEEISGSAIAKTDGQSAETAAVDAVSAPVPVSTSQAIDNPSPSTAELLPDRRCYQLESETESVDIFLDVAANGSVTGKVDGTVHNDQLGYYTSYQQEIEGKLEGDRLPVTLLTRIELDLQQSQETWQLDGDQLLTGRSPYQDRLDQIDCSRLGNLDAVAPPTSTLSPVTTVARPPAEGGNRLITQRVSFLPGNSETRIEDSVVRGDRMAYLVGASAGQTLFLTLASLEQNAVMDLIGPDDSVIWTGKVGDRLVLPQSGDYKIVVGGTRGNATYALTIMILSLGE